MKFKYEEKFYSTEYPQGYTYIGIYIRLYGMNDAIVMLYMKILFWQMDHTVNN